MNAYVPSFGHCVRIPDGWRVVSSGHVERGDRFLVRIKGTDVWRPGTDRLAMSVGKLNLVIRPDGGRTDAMDRS